MRHHTETRENGILPEIAERDSSFLQEDRGGEGTEWGPRRVERQLL